jgi:EAL domain-containing protein (putative c-di-GMP-specific phosphodiesterase class I)
MDVVAEGIEIEAVRTKLLELGCNYGQGWLFGRPVELKDISG